MSKRRELEQRIKSLHEIQSIMVSMKNLAVIETHKLTRYQENQQRVVDAMARALNDVRQYLAEDMSGDIEGDVGGANVPSLYLLFGSERGFCGAYNEQLLEVLAQQADYEQAPLIAVGTRLVGTVQSRFEHAVCLPGASVADEVPAVLAQVLGAINQARARYSNRHGELRVQVIYFQPEDQVARCQPLLPPVTKVSGHGVTPVTNLAPKQLLQELLEHYLFALSHSWFFSALMTENQKRLQHLGHAERHLQKQLDAMAKRRNVLRQEEIVEEIEVILLSAEAVSTPGV